MHFQNSDIMYRKKLRHWSMVHGPKTWEWVSVAFLQITVVKHMRSTLSVLKKTWDSLFFFTVLLLVLVYDKGYPLFIYWYSLLNYHFLVLIQNNNNNNNNMQFKKKKINKLKWIYKCTNIISLLIIHIILCLIILSEKYRYIYFLL
jgi:hypothetical protein